MTSSGMKRGLAATAISALAVTGLPFLAAAAKLVAVEDHLAESYENLGATDPQRHARHLKMAQEAREAARHARIAAGQVNADRIDSVERS